MPKTADNARDLWLSLPEHERMTALSRAAARTIYYSLVDAAELQRNVVLLDMQQYKVDVLILFGALSEFRPDVVDIAMQDGMVEAIATMRDEGREVPK